jgi:hypothetical protein
MGAVQGEGEGTGPIVEMSVDQVPFRAGRDEVGGRGRAVVVYVRMGTEWRAGEASGGMGGHPGAPQATRRWFWGMGNDTLGV